MKKSRRPVRTTAAAPPWAPVPWAAALLIAAAALAAWITRPFLPVEDGIIYLRYAFNLANGYGLVFNPGEYYESNTNFLWSVLLVVPFWFGWDAPAYLQILGIGIMSVALCLLYDIVRRLQNRVVAFVAVLLLGTHGAFVFVSPSGFAPHLASLFLLSAITFYLRWTEQPRVRYAFAVGVSLALVLLTRLDAAILFAVVWMMLCLSAIAARSASKNIATPPHPEKRANRLLVGVTARLNGV